MPATVVAERVGCDRSITVLRNRLRELRPLFLPPDPAPRTSYSPGELGHCDLWFPPGRRAARGHTRVSRGLRWFRTLILAVLT
jgi:hypothetical protein